MSPTVWLWFAALSLLSGCSNGATGRPARLADGGYSLSCRGPLSDCLRHAERLCRDQGYAVREARDVRERLGAETGQSQVVIQKSEATIYCGESKPAAGASVRLQREPEPETTPAAPAASPPPAAPATPASRACTPGATQACVGPGGCTGGQACANDGARFEPCNCGGPTAPVSAPSTP